MENNLKKLQYLYTISIEWNMPKVIQQKFIFYYLLRDFPVGNGITYIDEWIQRFLTKTECEFSDSEGNQTLDLLDKIFD